MADSVCHAPSILNDISEILSKVTLDSLQQIIILNLFNSVLFRDLGLTTFRSYAISPPVCLEQGLYFVLMYLVHSSKYYFVNF